MSIMPDRRSRKRLATRQSISDAATRLFVERGFDRVTVDEIAAAADVGRMTVFNHFPRKEDMFFDRDDEGRARLRAALLERPAGVSPLESLRRLARCLIDEQSPYASFTPATRDYVLTVEQSETLTARARAIRDEVADVVALALCESVGRAPDDADARLASALLLAAWSVAFVRAHRAYREAGDASAASRLFTAILERGNTGVAAALAGTPYASRAGA